MDQANLIWLLDDSEVLPVINLESLILAETAEGLILDCLLKRCELVASLWNNCTIKLDRMNDLTESVKLRYILSRNNDAFVFVNDNSSASRGVKHNSVMLTSKEYIQFSEILCEFLNRGRKSREDEVGRRTPIEVLGRESMRLLSVI